MTKIHGGYYIKSRKIEESDIAHAPPCTREIWDYLLRMANHSDNGICKRGQHITTLNKIREALHWYAGWRKEMYKISACENSMKWLKKAGMITTKKTVRGSIITIENYSFYQNPSNYESRIENVTKNLGKPDNCRMINKNEKNDKNEKNKYNSQATPDRFQIIGELWNTMAKQNGLACVKFPLSKDRIKNMKPALEEFPNSQDWIDILSEIPANKYNLGHGDTGWRANFDWLFYKTKFNYRKLYEASKIGE